MKIALIAGKELCRELKGRWAEIQLADPDLASPYFHPEYFSAVAAVRKDVYCAVLEEGNRVVGFFPFQRRIFGIGHPVGGPLSDYQGILVDKNVEVNPTELVKNCGLSIWLFDHLIVAQKEFHAFCSKMAESFRLDLSKGYKAYVEERRKDGSMQINKLARKEKMLARKVGPLRFVMQSNDGTVLKQLMRWKSEQCIRTGGVDIFSFRWTVELLERIHAVGEDAFGGRLSALYAGDSLLAAHLGMRSRSVWHWWFPSYNRDYAKYSPGLILLLKAAEAAESTGLRAIDLGKGADVYKQHFTNSAVPIGEGMVTSSFAPALIRKLRQKAEGWIRKSPLYVAARFPGRIVRRLERWYGFQ